MSTRHDIVLSDVCVQCSYSVCYATRDENARLVREFVDRYESDSDRPFDCYYDTETKDNVVGHKTYTSVDVVHCLLWPCLLLAACAAIFVYLELKRRNIDGTPYVSGVNGGQHYKHHDGRRPDVVVVAVSQPSATDNPVHPICHGERGRPTG